MSLFNGKYVSVETIISKVYRDMGMSGAIEFGDALEWAGEAMELIGANNYLIESVKEVFVNEYRACIPIELFQIITVGASPVADDTPQEECREGKSFTQMRYSTDANHHWYCDSSNDSNCQGSLTYKVNDSFIFTNFKTGYVKIAMVSMPVDDRGFPQIPDDPKFKEAVAGHIKWKLAFIKWSNGKMPGAVYQKLEQDRDWYIGAAQNRGVMPGVDMMESIKNNWLRLIPKINQHADGFKSAGEAEQRFNHNTVGGSDGRNSNQSDTETYFKAS
tara:strand:- start:6907 stop:7728 length:822 start_codon:yes stop_codon:yes gene_type:complete